MSYRFVGRIVGVAAVIAATACGPTPTSPTPVVVPSLAPLLLPRVGGMWGGTLTFNSVSGGQGIVPAAGLLSCVGDTFTRASGQANDNILDITQDGINVEARLRSSSTGLACTYTGRVSPNGTIALDSAQCHEDPLVIRCINNAGVVAVQQMELVGSTLTATLDAPVNVTTFTGVAAHTYNLPEGGLVARHSFTLTRR